MVDGSARVAVAVAASESGFRNISASRASSSGATASGCKCAQYVSFVAAPSAPAAVSVAAGLGDGCLIGSQCRRFRCESWGERETHREGDKLDETSQRRMRTCSQRDKRERRAKEGSARMHR